MGSCHRRARHVGVHPGELPVGLAGLGCQQQGMGNLPCANSRYLEFNLVMHSIHWTSWKLGMNCKHFK